MEVKLVSYTKSLHNLDISKDVDVHVEREKTLEEIVVEIARVSSSRKDKLANPVPLIKHLVQNKHWSPFEMVDLTFEIKTSRAIGTQLLRHRSMSFQEFSQRYAKVVEIEPVELRRQATSNRQSSEEVFNPELTVSFLPPNALATEVVDEVLEICKEAYEKLVEAGVAKECARFVLPLAAQTTIYMKGSLRSWIHFLNIRLEKHAQKEVQLIANEIAREIKKHCPVITEALDDFNNFEGGLSL